MNTDWPFEDAPNTASYTTSFVLDGSPILRVYHDYEGGWQFHGAQDQPATTEVARLLALESIIVRDASLMELHDLPRGWRATRAAVGSGWVRAKNNPFPTHQDDGYYLDDAVWMSQYRDDIDLPPEDLRKNLPVSAYVKLLFRFAAEDAERQDDETERMWVRIVELDTNEHYVGTLENDPDHSQVLNHGDTIHFHPSHVMAILDDEEVS